MSIMKEMQYTVPLTYISAEALRWWMFLSLDGVIYSILAVVFLPRSPVNEGVREKKRAG